MNQLPFEVRLATNSDAPAIRELVFPIMEAFGLGLDPEGADHDLYDIQTSYFVTGGWLELVCLDDALVGTVGMLPIADGVIELRKMYLHADIRGKGLGKALLARSIVRAQTEGYRIISLETATALKSAIGLYQRFGFVRDTDHYPGCGKNACDQVWRLQLESYHLPDTELAKLKECRDSA